MPLSVFVDPDHVRFGPRGIGGGAAGDALEVAVNGRTLSFEEIQWARCDSSSKGAT